VTAASGGRIGEVLAGKYELVALVGQGGMGAVYEARHKILGRRFAIKVLRPELCDRPTMMERFQREAMAAGALENDNIAAVTDLGVAPDGAPYLVMEFLEGENLAALLARQGPLAAPRAADIVRQAAYGLLAAHDKGIVHRDLKPENLFVCRRNDGTDLVKILDFGIAKLQLEPRDANITATGASIGTPHYMAPEQARGEKRVDHRVDLYALGVILYELLAGAVPHPGDSYNEILYHIFSKRPRPLDELRPGLPQGLSRLVHQLLEAEADRRVQTMVELVEQLGAYAPREPAAEAAAASPLSRANADTVPTGVTNVTLAPAGSDGTRSRARATRVVSIAALLVTVAALIYVGLSREPASEHAGSEERAAAAEPAAPAEPAAQPASPSSAAPSAEPSVSASASAEPRPDTRRAARGRAATSASPSAKGSSGPAEVEYDRANPYGH
jgi:serine/threonine protein kinase